MIIRILTVMRRLCLWIKIPRIRLKIRLIAHGLFWTLRVWLELFGILACFWVLFIRDILCLWGLLLIWSKEILGFILELLLIPLLCLIFCLILILAFFWKEKKLWIELLLLKITWDCGFGLICLVAFLILGLLQQLLI